MYPRSNGHPLRDTRLSQHPLFYLRRNPRGVQNGGIGGHGGHVGHQQAAGGEVRGQRRPTTAAAVQGRDGLHGGSVRSRIPQDPSITISQENSQSTSPTQEQSLDLAAYISENFGTLQQLFSDFADRLDRLSAGDEAFHKSIESTLTNLAERVKTLSVKVESFYKIIESAQAFPAPEGLEADGVDLRDMTSLVNFQLQDTI